MLLANGCKLKVNYRNAQEGLAGLILKKEEYFLYNFRKIPRQMNARP